MGNDGIEPGRSVVPPGPGTDLLEVEVDGPVATLVLDRPDVLNALSVELLDDLVTTVAEVDALPDVRVIVLRGAGRTFSAGADLSTVSRLLADDASARDAADAGHRAAMAIESAQAVTLAAIHGRCIGGGVVLALACDLRIASDRARFSIPEIDLGIPLAWGGIPRMLREVGPGLTRDLVLTGREFGAQEARVAGIVSQVVANDDLDAAVDELAAGVAAKAPLPVRATLDAVAACAGVGTPAGWSDADTLLSAVRDPQSRAIAEQALADFAGDGG